MAELKLSTAIKERKEDKSLSEKKKNDWLEEEIYIEFYNLEEPGVPLKFAFGSSKRPKTYTLIHGGKYHLPREVVNHIESRETPLYGYKPDGTGRQIRDLKGKKSRFQCRQIFE